MPPHSSTPNYTIVDKYWAERRLETVSSLEGLLERGKLTAIGLGTFMKGLEGMREDGRGNTDHQGEHPAYITNKTERQTMRAELENWILDLVSELLSARLHLRCERSFF